MRAYLTMSFNTVYFLTLMRICQRSQQISSNDSAQCVIQSAGLNLLSSRCAPCRGICKHLQVKSREQTRPRAFSGAALHLAAQRGSEREDASV